ncbi:hypothetical protein F4604DRAFT_1717253 [Suillus subluteus]|nr:hypothetical protein F4604DRAFT_1717253 [Suillus subluteus]
MNAKELKVFATQMWIIAALAMNARSVIVSHRMDMRGPEQQMSYSESCFCFLIGAVWLMTPL